MVKIHIQIQLTYLSKMVQPSIETTIPVMYGGPNGAVCTLLWLNAAQYEFYINVLAESMRGLTHNWEINTSVTYFKLHFISIIILYFTC